MFFSSVFIVGLISARINAIPLNINLGAYSPALVVGDGEISFRGKEEVSELMDALEGAAVSGATKNGASGDGTDTADAGEGLGAPQNSVIPGAPLQGMGKIITPRITNLARKDQKRDINGFNAALSYASDSLTKGPAVELSTGTSGSGVGVRVNPKAAGTKQAQIATYSPPKAARPIPPQNGLGKREDSHANESPKTETTVTTMLIRGVSNSESEKDTESLNRRSTPNTEDVENVNLNVADGQLAELTFVETRSVKESDKEIE